MGICIGWLLVAGVLVVFVAVMVSENSTGGIAALLGLSQKSEILQFLGVSMEGLLIALQALAAHRRAQAMEETASA